MPEITPVLFSQIFDRFSMNMFFTQVYTTSSKRPSLKALVFTSKIHPDDLDAIVSRRSELDGFNFKIEKMDTNLYTIILSREIKNEMNTGILLLDVNESDSWVIFTNKGTYYVNHVVESFFDKLYPLISRIYFNIDQMKRFVDRIKDEYKGRSTFTSLTLNRNMKQWKLMGKSKKSGTLILYEDEADEEIPKLLKDYFISIIKLNFNIVDSNDNLLLRANIYRNGKCSLSYGDFNSFYYNVVLKIIEYGREWRAFYADRQRNIIQNNILLNPFSIIYSEKLGVPEIHKLSRKISMVYSCAIIHNGNPYFVANISDYEEGSSFGVTALENQITVTPISRGTDIASWKLAETIQQILGDGLIQNVLTL